MFEIIYKYLIITVLGFSIYRIRKYSKLLVKNKIFVNECLMITHLISFAGYAMTYSGYIALFYITDSDSNDQSELNKHRYEYGDSIIICFEFLTLFGVYTTMYIMFIKHSKPLSND